LDNLFDSYVVDNFFTEEELAAVWEDLDYFLANGCFTGNHEAHGACTYKESGKPLTNKQGFFPQEYVPITEMKCYSACCKIFQNDTVEFSKKSFANRSILATTEHNMLFSLYLNGGEYKKHYDYSVSTVLFWLNKEPKKFTGGDLILHDIDKKIDYANNRMVIIPGWCEHEVTPVVMDEDEDPTNGRFCISMFLST
jgi:Rps23 Pro-64 3,4-dihydroxylase Tpa1-like proline 4-hydroxylase